MTAVVVLRQMLRERLRPLVWWSVAMAALTVVLGASYPTVEETAGDIEQIMESLPEGFGDLLGATGGLATPDGYLNSNFYANLLPVLLLVFGIGLAGWTVAGAEREGTLEPLLANPVRRGWVALGRFAGLVLLLAALTLVPTVLLIALRGPFSLGEIGQGYLFAAGVASFLLALLFSALTYGVGAATGSKGLAVAVGAGVAAATYVIFALASFVELFQELEWLSPWHWFLDASPLTDGWTWQAMGLPLLVIVPAVVAGVARFSRRDLR